MTRSRLLALSLTLALAAPACTAPLGGDDPDPAATLGDDAWWDEGPPPGEEGDAPAEDPELGTLSEELSGVPAFQLPFPCGQVWAGQTRTGHSPQLAIDFNRANDVGDTVVAAAAGTVTRVENLGSTSYGRWIEIDHGGGYRTRYAHLLSQRVSVGQRVSEGEAIGQVGDTGGSTGPHLHFELRRYGSAVRPVFDGSTAFFYGTRNYTSHNACGGGGGGTAITGRVRTSGASLNVRATASTSGRVVGSLANGASVRITCQRRGSSVTGPYGISTLWDYIGTGYVSDAYVYTGTDGQVAPTCR